MIARGPVSLTALIGLFTAGAAVCAYGLARTLLGWPVSVADLLLFVLVACAVTGAGWRRLMDAEHARERLWLSGEELRQAGLEREWASDVEPVTELEADDDDFRRAWQLSLDRFFRAGEAAGGFSIRKLDGVVGSDGWAALTHFYGSEAGGNVLRDAGGATGYTFGYGWSLDRVMMALHANRLPYPDGPVPVVQPYVRTQRNAKRQSATVVEA